MEQYRLTKQQLWDTLQLWDEFLPGRVRLVACGGTALTLQDLKTSTKDVDFIAPDDGEFRRLIGTLKRLDYRKHTGTGWKKDGSPFIIDVFAGKAVFTTELLDSPLEPGMSLPIRSFKRLEIAALNDLDLVISKMFRGDDVDVEDSRALIRGRGAAFDMEKLKERYAETAKYDINEEDKMRKLGRLLKRLEGKSA